MDRVVTTVINADLCNGCGLCLRVCPAETLSLVDRRARVTGDKCIACGHCAAVCPEGAVGVGALAAGAGEFATFQVADEWLPPGDFDLPALVRLMRSRRSCRNYAEKPVSRDVLEDLVKIGITAPSGSNEQCWTFTIVPEPQAMIALGREIAKFFRRLNRLAERGWMRLLSRLFLKDALGVYYRDYYESVRQGLIDWDERGLDPLFHGAPAAIIIGGRNQNSTPAEDALLAAENILLAAHAMGLGTCLIGFAVEALKRDPRIKQALGIPDNEKIYAVVALGYPKEKYRRAAGRKPVVPRWFNK